MIYKDGSIYIGDFKENKRHGYGQLSEMGGNLYFGEW